MMIFIDFILDLLRFLMIWRLSGSTGRGTQWPGLRWGAADSASQKCHSDEESDRNVKIFDVLAAIHFEINQLRHRFQKIRKSTFDGFFGGGHLRGFGRGWGQPVESEPAGGGFLRFLRFWGARSRPGRRF